MNFFDNHLFSSSLFGALGGVVTVLTGRTNWRAAVAAVLVGGASAAASAPYFAQFLPGDYALGLVAYSIGLTGVGFTSFLIEFVRRLSRQHLGDDGASDDPQEGE